MTIQLPGFQGLVAVSPDPGQVLRPSSRSRDPGPQAVEAAAQELPDTPKAQHQALLAQKRPVQPLHGGLDGSLRRGGGVGYRQLLPEEVVLHRQAQGLRLLPLLGPHLARQNPLLGPEAAEQVRRGHRALLTV